MRRRGALRSTVYLSRLIKENGSLIAVVILLAGFQKAVEKHRNLGSLIVELECVAGRRPSIDISRTSSLISSAQSHLHKSAGHLVFVLNLGGCSPTDATAAKGDLEKIVRAVKSIGGAIKVGCIGFVQFK